MKNFLSETGRSMVEMLGVLAIIGVLSISAIYGYQMAMRRYRANEIAQTVSILYTMAKSANGGEGECITLSSTSLGTKIAGVDVEMVADATVSPVTINIQMDDDDLCSAVVNMFPDDADDYTVDCGAVDCD